MKTVHALMVLLIAGIAARGNAGVTNVTAGGPAYATITQAVAAAGASARLLVSTGLYREAVIVSGKSLVIEGGYMPGFGSRTNYAPWTVVTPGGAGRVMTVQNGSSVVLDGLSVTGGVIFGTGGGVMVDVGCTVTAVQCQVMDNRALFGGGVAVGSNGYVLLTNTWVGMNMAAFGGGIVAQNNGRVTVSGAEAAIVGNWAVAGGGASLLQSRMEIADGAWVTANTAVERGGGVALEQGSRLEVRGSGTRVGGYWLFYNQATNNGTGGGIWAAESEVVVSGEQCHVANNVATECGGGVYLSNSVMAVIDGAGIGAGDGINAAGRDGGGVYLLGSTLVLTNGAYVITGLALTNGGGVMGKHSVIVAADGVWIGHTNSALGNVARNGAGVYLENSTAVLTRVTVAGNTAGNAGGGMVATWFSEVQCAGTRISENVATNGGGFACDEMYGGVLFDDCQIVSNVARKIGGGIMVAATKPIRVVNGSKVNYNTAGGVAGGVFVLFGTTMCEHADIGYNAAGAHGGGAAVWPTANLVCGDTDIHENGADGMGGGVYNWRGTLMMEARTRACGMMSNTAVHGGGVFVLQGRVLCGAAGADALRLAGNQALTNGGWLYASTGAVVSIAGNVWLEGNRAEVGGGAVILTNCFMELCASNGAGPVVYGNEAARAGGGLVALEEGARLALRGVALRGNVSMGSGSIYGGGAVAMGVRGELEARDCVFVDNVSSNLGGAISVIGQTRRITVGSSGGAVPGVWPKTQFRGNYAENHGGALCVLGCERLEVSEALIVSNRAGLSGGAMTFTESYTGRIVNTVLTRNAAGGEGDAILAGEYSWLEIQHCTIADNMSNGVANVSTITGVPVLENCIVWGHITSQIWGAATVRFSDVQGGYPGLFNLSTNPVFFAPEALRYDLAESSPCIDKGATLFSITNDCIGTVRPQGAGWDMGAYEFVPEPAGVGALLGIGFPIYKLQSTICGRRRRK